MTRRKTLFHTMLAAALLSACAIGSNAYAVIISTPVDYTTANLVGTADPGTAAATVANQLVWANQILALTAPTTTTILGVNYRTHDADEYSGILTDDGAFKTDGSAGTIGAGWEYVMGKYDGQNAGYILFYLGGEASTIPEFSNDIWNVNPSEGYQLSNWTVFGRVQVPEPGTLALFGAALVGFGLARRRKLLAPRL